MKLGKTIPVIAFFFIIGIFSGYTLFLNLSDYSRETEVEPETNDYSEELTALESDLNETLKLLSSRESEIVDQKTKIKILQSSNSDLENEMSINNMEKNRLQLEYTKLPQITVEKKEVHVPIDLMSKEKIAWIPIESEYNYRYWECHIDVSKLNWNESNPERGLYIYFRGGSPVDWEGLTLRLYRFSSSMRLWQRWENGSETPISDWILHFDFKEKIIIKIKHEKEFQNQVYLEFGEFFWHGRFQIQYGQPYRLTHIGVRSRQGKALLQNSPGADITVSGVQGSPIFTLAQITDTHCGQRENTQNTNDTIQWIIKQQPVDFIVHTGDLVQEWDDTSQWDSIYNMMHQFDGTHQWMTCAGNHDVSDSMGVSNYTYYSNTFGAEKIRYVETYGPFAMISFSWESGGTITDTTLDWLDEQLEKYSEYKIILFTHWLYSKEPEGHNYFSNPSLLELWETHLNNHSNIVLILSGHNHENDHSLKPHGNSIIPFIVSGSTGENSILRIIEFYSDSSIDIRTRNVNREVWIDSEHISVRQPSSFSDVPTRFEVISDGSNVYVEDALTKERISSGQDHGEQINFALKSLTSGRTWMERVVLKGNFSVRPSNENTDPTIDIPSFTILELQGEIHYEDGPEPFNPLIGNEDYHNGNDQIILTGGKYFGNNISHHIIKFAGVASYLENIIISDVSIVSKCLNSDGITLGFVDGFKISECKLEGIGEEALELIACKNGEVYKNEIDGFGGNGNPQLDIWCQLTNKVVSNSILVRDNKISNSMGYISVLIFGSNITILNNHIKNSVNHGIFIIFKESFPEIRDIKIIENGIEGSQNTVQKGILTLKEGANYFKELYIANNVIKNFGDSGINLINVADFNLVNNHVYNCGRREGQNGVFLQNTNNGTIISPRYINNGLADSLEGNGLYLLNCSNIMLVGGKITKNTGYGIYEAIDVLNFRHIGVDLSANIAGEHYSENKENI